MSTSGVYTITKNFNQIANQILKYLGVTQIGQAANPYQLEVVKDVINMWLLQQKGQPHIGRPGLMMWLKEIASLTLVASQSLYELKPSGGDLDIQVPTDVLSANLKYTSTNDEVPLIPKTSGEYELITNKSDTGTPVYYYYENRNSTGYFYISPAPDSDVASDYTIRLVYRQPMEVISVGTNDFDIADFWYRAMVYNVALDTAPFFSATITEIMKNRADESLAAMNTFYHENAGGLYFQPFLEED